jgi:hypothetical protein
VEKELQKPRPFWIDQVPLEAGTHYFVGEATGAAHRGEALEKAWISAFVRIGMTEFPELTSLISQNDETLRGTAYHRRFFMNLESVNWVGITEAVDYGSPYLEYNPHTEQYTAYRLLKWADRDLQIAKGHVRHEAHHHIPGTPETAERERKALVEGVMEMQRINHRIDFHNTLVQKVLSEIKCGVTVADLIQVLGSPDRANPFNGHLMEKEYYWGNYKVERVGDNPAVTAITNENGLGERKLICNRMPAPRADEAN